ncbi:quinone oxidoreductase family protein [Brevibacillus marinus]|uniref:quinone oxidoreductase family protein n=1 Tax=Brevibacillus marinus TaxID=2496837 RepID=UPI000F831E97|nr:NADPH:quinone oxidoreductase family protein [Brevibacillus marinus]
MNAIIVSRFGGPDVLAYEKVEIPPIGPDDVLIRVEAASVNFADIKARYGSKEGKQPPFVPGLDCAGEIVQIGANVQNFRVGQRVLAFPKSGSYAEYAVAHSLLTFAIPDQLDYATAAACPIVSFTSWFLLADVGRLKPGEAVLVHAAAGGVGTTAIQLAKILGAGTVIGTVSREDKIPVAKEAGADYVIDTSQDDFVAKTLEITAGKGADLILDSIAGSVTERGMNCLAPYGRLVQFGNASGQAASIQTKDLHASCRAVLGFSFGTTRKLRPERAREAAEHVLRYLQEGALRPVIGHRFPLADARLAQEVVENRESKGKVLLIPPASSLRA